MAKKLKSVVRPEVEPRQVLRYIAWIFGAGRLAADHPGPGQL